MLKKWVCMLRVNQGKIVNLVERMRLITSEYVIFLLLVGLAMSFFVSVGGLGKKYFLPNPKDFLLYSSFIIVYFCGTWYFFKKYLLEASNKVFILSILLFSFILKCSLVLMLQGYVQTGDYNSMHEIVSIISHHGFNGELLSHYYDFKPFAGRALPVWLLIRKLGGQGDIFFTQIVNCFLSSFNLLLIFSLLLNVVGDKIRRFSVYLIAIFPLHFWEVLNYTHDIPGTFFFLLCLYLIKKIINNYNSKTIETLLNSILLGGMIFILDLQRGFGLLVIFIIIIFLGMIILFKKMINEKLVFFVLIVPALIFFPAQKIFTGYLNSVDTLKIRGGGDAFMARGWSLETLGEYNSLYEKIDKATPVSQKRKTNLAIVFSQIRYNFKPIFTKLLPVKVSKFFLVGYSSSVEGSILKMNRPFLSRIAVFSRVLFAPLLLLLACFGCIVCLRDKQKSVWLIQLISIPVIACLLVVFFGETSPRYSYSFHFVICMLGGVGIYALKRNMFQLVLTNKGIRKRFFYYFFFTAIVYVCLAMFLYFSITNFFNRYLFVDMRKGYVHSQLGENQSINLSNTLMPLEQWLVFPKGVLTHGASSKGEVPFKSEKGRSCNISMYIYSEENIELLRGFKYNLSVNGDSLEQGDLESLRAVTLLNFKNVKEKELRSKINLEIRYEGEKPIDMNTEKVFARWGYILVN